MKKQLLIAAALCFAANPKDEEYQVTDDGQCFKTWHDANEHSKTIGVREVVTIKRGDCEIEEEVGTGKKGKK
jgi:hypothetical protein